MNEGISATLIIGDESYKVDHYKLNERIDNNYFCSNLELTIDGDFDLNEDEPYIARLQVNGDATWYFPWIWVKKTQNKVTASIHGAIFCPLGLSEADEEKYDSINLIVASDVRTSMTVEVWRNLLQVFSDWLKARSVPQYKEFLDLSKEI